MPSFFGQNFDLLVRRLLSRLGYSSRQIKIRTATLSGEWGTCHIGSRKGVRVAVVTISRVEQGRMPREAYVTLVVDTLLHEVAHAIVMLDGRDTSHSRGWAAAYSRVYAAWEAMLEDGEACF